MKVEFDEFNNRLLKISEVAEAWRVTRETVVSWGDDGLIPMVCTPAGDRRFPESVLDPIVCHGLFTPDERAELLCDIDDEEARWILHHLAEIDPAGFDRLTASWRRHLDESDRPVADHLAALRRLVEVPS